MAKTKKKKKSIPLSEVGEGNREILFDILAREKVDEVTIEFDGGGDDGSLEPSDLPDEIKKIVVQGSRISLGRIWDNSSTTIRWKEDCTVEEILESLCYEVLENQYGGWENNDGAFGEFVFDVKKRTVHFSFNQRYTESELFEHTF